MEKCLSYFDKDVQEWADFISFLKQLLKVRTQPCRVFRSVAHPRCVQTFQSYQQFKEIPRKLVVSKRLSQCLNPALPNGVHQRALDVYSHIFAVLGVCSTLPSFLFTPSKPRALVGRTAAGSGVMVFRVVPVL